MLHRGRRALVQLARRFSDEQIAALLAERKVLPRGWTGRLRTRAKRGHSEGELSVTGEGGNEFRIILRSSVADPLNFSAILAVQPLISYELFRLRRYNGLSHEHTNHLEGERFFAFHVHHATARYQDAGLDEDGYAVPADHYGTLDSALRCLIDECGIEDPHHDPTAPEQLGLLNT